MYAINRSINFVINCCYERTSFKNYGTNVAERWSNIGKKCMIFFKLTLFSYNLLAFAKHS